MNLTPEQSAAIYTLGRNLIVVAGAGSGKTRVLVERFLALLEQHPDWPLNSLVAITYTRKAAQEMRDRLRQELETRRHNAPDDAARAHWETRIGELPGARIDTIHGLCASILRANAAEAGLDPGFAVLDEVQAALLLDDVIDDVLVQIAQDDTPEAELLATYETRALKQALVRCVQTDWSDPPDNLLERWVAAWAQNLEQVLARWLHSARLAEALAWSPADGWPAAPDKLAELFMYVRDQIERLRRPDEPFSRYQALDELRTSINLQVGSKSAWGGEAGLKQAKSVLGSIRDLMDGALKAIGSPPGEADRRAAELVPLWAALGRRARDAFRRAKLGQSPPALDFDDLERLSQELLRRSPVVRARYQNAEFKHLLVDEFQDTNLAQWEIVRALADPERPGSLFVVGDPKQSIYEFRGADVSVFEEVRRAILRADGQELPLSQSFRAHAPLVARFNHIFSTILVKDPDSAAPDYEVELGQPMTAARLEAPADVPLIELLLIDKGRLDPATPSLAEAARRWEAQALAERLQALAHAERPVYDRQTGQTRPMHYGDVAVLFQSLNAVVLYEDALKAAEIPYVTVSGRGYFGRQEVWDVLNLLRALHDPADDLALAAALRSPLFGLSDDALLGLRLSTGADGRRLPLSEALGADAILPDDERERAAFADRCFRELRQLAGRMTLAELIREILARTGYLATLTGLPDGARRRGNVDKLVNLAQASGQIMLGAFDAYLRDLSDREVREGEALVEVQGAVTLMSVHASKGLEFPIVALADASWSRGASSASPLLVDRKVGLACKVRDPAGDDLEVPFVYRQLQALRAGREAAENRRKLYVAMTRAQDYLLISGQFEHDKDGGLKLAGWLSWLIPALLPESEDLQPGQSVSTDGSVRVIVPAAAPQPRLLPERHEASGWELPEVQAGGRLPGPAQEPPLLRPLPVAPASRARHLTATQLADLGSARINAYYRERFRRSVLQETPTRVETVSNRTGSVSQRLVGELVHRVLRWQFPDERDNVEAVLRSYAWQLGIVDERQRDMAVKAARSLLDRMRASQAAAWLRTAIQIHRELPFIYRTEKRIIHGVLDVLLERPDGSWVILDYKTSLVPGYRQGPPGAALLAEHARRFHLQVGIYAAAVRDYLRGLAPEVYIDYIRYGVAVRVETPEWEAALAQLEAEIGHLVGEEDWE